MRQAHKLSDAFASSASNPAVDSMVQRSDNANTSQAARCLHNVSEEYPESEKHNSTYENLQRLDSHLGGAPVFGGCADVEDHGLYDNGPHLNTESSGES